MSVGRLFRCSTAYISYGATIIYCCGMAPFASYATRAIAESLAGTSASISSGSVFSEPWTNLSTRGATRKREMRAGQASYRRSAVDRGPWIC